MCSKKTKKNILSFTTYLPSPVIPRENDVSLQIYKGLEEDYEVEIFKSLNIVPFFNRKYEMYRKLKRDGSYYHGQTKINIYSFPNFKDSITLKAYYFQFLYFLFFRKIDKSRYDIIHSNNIYPDFFMGYFTAKRTGLPHFCTVRGNKRQVESFLNINKKFFIGTSFSSPDPYVVEVFKSKNIPISFIPHGIKNQYFKAEPKISENRETFKFIIVNRLLQMKRISNIIDFFYYFKSKGFKFCCEIIGEGDQMHSLTEQVKNLQMQDEISFLGHQTRDVVSEKLKKADFYYTNSKSETFGLSIVEALAAGCLIVAPKNIGVVNLFNDQDFFIEFTSDSDLLLNQIMVKNREIENLKEQAYSYALNFRWDRMLKNYNDFFNGK